MDFGFSNTEIERNSIVGKKMLKKCLLEIYFSICFRNRGMSEGKIPQYYILLGCQYPNIIFF